MKHAAALDKSRLFEADVAIMDALAVHDCQHPDEELAKVCNHIGAHFFNSFKFFFWVFFSLVVFGRPFVFSYRSLVVILFYKKARVI